jgi:hypothetical protein
MEVARVADLAALRDTNVAHSELRAVPAYAASIRHDGWVKRNAIPKSSCHVVVGGLCPALVGSLPDVDKCYKSLTTE